MIKVVKETKRGSLVSAVVDNKARIRYKVGEWVKAKRDFIKRGYGIFVYETLEDAIINTIGTIGHDKDHLNTKFKYYEIEAKDEMQKTLIMHYYVASEYGANGIEELKKKFGTKRLPPYMLMRLTSPPAGTKMFKEIKLVRKITNEEIKGTIKKIK